MVNSEAINVTLLVTDVLDELNIPYVIGGLVASIAYETTTNLRPYPPISLPAPLKDETAEYDATTG